MKFRNHTDEALDLPAIGVRVPSGEDFDVTGDAAQALLDQGFPRVDEPRTRRNDEEKS